MKKRLVDLLLGDTRWLGGPVILALVTMGIKGVFSYEVEEKELKAVESIRYLGDR